MATYLNEEDFNDNDGEASPQIDGQTETTAAEQTPPPADPKFATLIEQWREGDDLKFEIDLGVRSFDVAHFFERCYGKVKEDPKGSCIFGFDVAMNWIGIGPAEVYNEKLGVNRSTSTAVMVESSYRDFGKLPMDEKVVYYVESELRRSYIRLFLKKLGFRKIPYEVFDLYFNNAVKESMKGGKKYFVAKANELKGCARKQFKELRNEEKADYEAAWKVLLAKIEEYIKDRSVIDVIPFDIECKRLFSPIVKNDALLPLPSQRILGATVLPTWSTIDAKGCFIEDLNRSKHRSTSHNVMWNRLSIVNRASYYRRACEKRSYLSKIMMGKKERLLEKSYVGTLKNYQHVIEPNESNHKEMDALEVAFLGLPEDAYKFLEEYNFEGFRACLKVLKDEVDGFYEIVRVEDMPVVLSV